MQKHRNISFSRARTASRLVQTIAASVLILFSISTAQAHKSASNTKTTTSYQTAELPGTVIVETGKRALYLVLPDGKALRYSIGVGRQGAAWRGSANIQRKAKWPRWTPTKNMIRRDPKLSRYETGMAGGLTNPLGARALYLYQGKRDTMYRIHGTNDPSSIGRAVSSGCIRLLNTDIKDLYERIELGAKVVVM